MGAAHRVLVTGVVNPTHVVYIASYLRRLLGDGPVEVRTAPGTSVDLSSPQLRPLLPEDEALQIRPATDWTWPTDAEPIYVAVGAPGLKAYARLRRANPRRRVRVVVTDEGLGTYGTWRTRRAAWGRQGVREPWRTVRAAAVAAGARQLTTQRWALYAQQDGEWTVVDEVASEFRRRVSARPSGGSPRRRVVMLTQPWVELGVVREAEYLAHVERLAETVAASGGTLAVRSHPREPAGRYADIGELARVAPAELDPQIVHASAVMGGPSTALLNLAAVHGVPTVRIGVPARPDLDDDISPAQAGLLQRFLGRAVREDEIAEQLDLR